MTSITEEKEENILMKADQKLKDKTRGIADLLVKLRITPNTVSYLGLLFAIITAVLIAIKLLDNPILAFLPILTFFLSNGLDFMDGQVARITGQASEAGAFLDSTLDRISDAVIIISFAFAELISFPMAYGTFFLVIMVSYSRSRAETLDVEMKNVGLMMRGVRFFYLLGLMTIDYFLNLIFGIRLFSLGWWIFVALLIVTFLHRSIYAYKELKKRKKKEMI